MALAKAKQAAIFAAIRRKRIPASYQERGDYDLHIDIIVEVDPGVSYADLGAAWRDGLITIEKGHLAVVSKHP